MNIVLIGYRYSGKTAVGEKLSEMLERPFYDTDAIIMAQTGRSIRGIVEEEGWQAFRVVEKAVIAGLAGIEGAVIAPGGGAVMESENVEVLKKKGLFVWLRASAETLIDRMKNDETALDQRPALTGSETITEVLEMVGKRTPVYEALADITMDTAGETIEEIAADIVVLFNHDAFSEIISERGTTHVR